jgi:hypothetical protein
MSQTGDIVTTEEYWSVRTAYEAGLRERMQGQPLTVTDSPVPGDAEYGIMSEPHWDESFFDPDDMYGSIKY